MIIPWLKFKKFDWLLFLASFILSGFSLLIIYSLAINQEGTNLTKFYHQLTALLIGSFLLFCLSLINLRKVSHFIFFGYILSLVLLILVLLIGQKTRGTTGWLNFGWLNFQPVELAKLFFLLFLAEYLCHASTNFLTNRQIIISLIITALPMALVLLQPDFGSALIFLLLWLMSLLLFKIKKYIWLLIILTLLFSILVSWQFIFTVRQQDRILNLFFPQRDPYNTGYQITQAEIAIGSGQLFGRGLGLGTQSQLHFLPDPETDFIFAVIGEEFGFLGVSMVFSLYFFLFYRLYLSIKQLNSNYSIFVAILIASLLFIQIFINIGMNLKLGPVIGLPLPFLSYGGSFLIICYLLLGIFQSLKIHN